MKKCSKPLPHMFLKASGTCSRNINNWPRNKNYLQIWLESMKRKVSEVTGIQDDKEINSLLWYLLCITVSFFYVLYQVFVIFKQ